jgi:hypothetical protein
MQELGKNHPDICNKNWKENLKKGSLVAMTRGAKKIIIVYLRKYCLG